MPPTYTRGLIVATGPRRYVVEGKKACRTSYMANIPIELWPCKIEENVSIVWENGRQVAKFETTVTRKGVVIQKYPGRFRAYKLTKEEQEEKRKKDARMMAKEARFQVVKVSSDDDSDAESVGSNTPQYLE